jgi:hypothetical protein
MSIKSIFSALVLVVLPGFALAQGCHNGMGREEQAMSCATGMHWDAEAGVCVPVASS